jgi:MarR family transcriptional regulator for hemolysin
MVPIVGETSLGFQIFRVFHLYRRELVRVLYQFDLTPEQWGILRTLECGNRAMSQNEIAEVNCLDKHSVSRMLKRLEERQLITRNVCTHDRRAFRVSHTQAADKLLELTSVALHKHMEKTVYCEFTTEEEAATLQLLKKLRRLMEASALQHEAAGLHAHTTIDRESFEGRSLF